MGLVNSCLSFRTINKDIGDLSAQGCYITPVSSGSILADFKLVTQLNDWKTAPVPAQVQVIQHNRLIK